MTRKLTLRSALSLLAVAGLTLGGIQPAHAVTKTQVTIWSYGNVIEPWGEQEYERLHPNIDLKIKKNSMDAHHQSLITAFKANTTPDIAAIEVSYSGFFRAYPKYFTNLSGIVNENDYLDWRWNQGVGSDGKVIGIPTDVGGLQVAYRKDLFKAHGLPTDRAAVSALWPTWQKFIDTGKTYVSKLTATEKTSCKVKKVCFGFIDNAGTMYPAILNQGAKKYYETNGTLIYNTNANVKTAFTTTATAMNSGISTRINQFTSDWNAGMMKGVFATVLAPAWMLDYIKQQAKSTSGKWDVADLPGGGGNLGGSQLSVPTAAKHPAEAKAFIAWYLSPAIQLEIFKRYGLFPSASSLYSNPALTGYKDKFFSNAPIGQIYVTGARQLRPIFEGKNQRAIDNYFGQALAKVAVGKMTASAAWSDAISQISKNIRN
jgi:cellobiose transport system substrate-binding protein